MSLTRQDWIDRFVTDLAMVVGALVERTTPHSPSADAPEGGWVVTLSGDHGARGSLLVHFDRDATEALTKRIVGFEVEPPEDAVIDTLKEVCSQAVGALVQEPPFSGIKLTVSSVQSASAGPGAASPALMQIAVDEHSTLRVAVWGDIELIPAEQPERAPVPASEPPQAAGNPKLDVILDIDLPLMVRFGRTELPLRALTTLGPGSVIDLGRSPDDPVDVLVSNRVVARGEVVIVGGYYGVRILDVLTPAARVSSMEAEG